MPFVYFDIALDFKLKHKKIINLCSNNLESQYLKENFKNCEA